MEAFAKAMRVIDREMVNATRQMQISGQSMARSPYHRLKDMGAWRPEWIATQYCLIGGKLCGLSSDLREYIIYVGVLAKKYFDEAKDKA